MIDIITIHPRGLDYPVWRRQLRDYREYYNNVIVAFEGAGTFEDFVRESVDGVFVDTFIGEGEWRDVAVNKALDKNNTEWVWFLEQDFFWKDKHFVETLLESTKTSDAIGFWEANRLHPSCLLVKKDFINATPRDFSPQPDVLDHFGKFSQSLSNIKACIKTLSELHLEPKKDWYHMQGLTHNYNLVRSGEVEKIFKRDEFLTYNYLAPRASVIQTEEYIALAELTKLRLGRHERIDWLAEFI